MSSSLFVACVLLISLLVACAVGQTCAPTFPANPSCVFTGVPPPLVFYIDSTQNNWVQPTAVSITLNTDLTVKYQVNGQFTNYPSGGTQFSVDSIVTWYGYWSTYSPTGENCGCSCSGMIMLGSVSSASAASCTDSYHVAHPGTYNFCTNFRFLNYYFSGQYAWAYNQDSSNKFLQLSRQGQTPGATQGNSFVPYTSTPGAMWGESVMYFSESGTCS